MSKRYYLELSDLVSNLFYILMDNNVDVNKISYVQIDKFRKILEKEADEKDIKLLFQLNRDEAIKFLTYNSDDFEEKDADGIQIKEGVTPIHLIWDYRSSLPLDVLILLSNDKVIDETLGMMGYVRSDEKVIRDEDYYIKLLEESIGVYALSMNFEKCMELRGKVRRLYHIKEELSEFDTKSQDRKPKIKSYPKPNSNSKLN